MAEGPLQANLDRHLRSIVVARAEANTVSVHLSLDRYCIGLTNHRLERPNAETVGVGSAGVLHPLSASPDPESAS